MEKIRHAEGVGEFEEKRVCGSPWGMVRRGLEKAEKVSPAVLVRYTGKKGVKFKSYQRVPQIVEGLGEGGSPWNACYEEATIAEGQIRNHILSWGRRWGWRRSELVRWQRARGRGGGWPRCPVRDGVERGRA